MAILETLVAALIAINLVMLYRLGGVVNEVRHLARRVEQLEAHYVCLQNSYKQSLPMQ